MKRWYIAVRYLGRLAAMREEEAIARAHFNFIKIHFLKHFGSIVQQFGSISLFLTN
jgi:hypothetical protein